MIRNNQEFEIKKWNQEKYRGEETVVMDFQFCADSIWGLGDNADSILREEEG